MSKFNDHTLYFGPMEPTLYDYVCFPVSGNWSCVSLELWDKLRGPKPEWGFENDACSMSPDGIRRARFWPACVIHDWHYSGSGPDVTRIKSDIIFAQNIITISRLQGANTIKAIGIAMTYFYFVRKFGGPFFKRKP